MKHKIAAILAVLILAFSFTGVTAFAENTYSEGYFYYTSGDGCVIITGYFGKDSVVVVPDNIAGYPVSVIAGGAFVGTSAKQLYLPVTIMEIEQGAIAEGIEVFYQNTPENSHSSGIEPQGGSTEPGGSTKSQGNDNTVNTGGGTNDSTAKNNTDSYRPLVQPERDENGTVAEGVNEGPEKIYVDEEGKLIQDSDEIKAIDEQQDAARQEKQAENQQTENNGMNGWLIGGIVLAAAAAVIVYLLVKKLKK